jgi:hypothetical protein
VSTPTRSHHHELVALRNSAKDIGTTAGNHVQSCARTCPFGGDTLWLGPDQDKDAGYPPATGSHDSQIGTNEHTGPARAHAGGVDLMTIEPYVSTARIVAERLEP